MKSCRLFQDVWHAAAHFCTPRKNIQQWLQERMDEMKGRKKKNRKGQWRKISHPKELNDSNSIQQWAIDVCPAGTNINGPETTSRSATIDSHNTAPLCSNQNWCWLQYAGNMDETPVYIDMYWEDIRYEGKEDNESKRSTISLQL